MVLGTSLPPSSLHVLPSHHFQQSAGKISCWSTWLANAVHCSQRRKAGYRNAARCIGVPDNCYWSTKPGRKRRQGTQQHTGILSSNAHVNIALHGLRHWVSVMCRALTLQLLMLSCSAGERTMLRCYLVCWKTNQLASQISMSATTLSNCLPPWPLSAHSAFKRYVHGCNGLSKDVSTCYLCCLSSTDHCLKSF